MNEAIQYYQRKLNDANDLKSIHYTRKLIQLEHQPTIDKTLDALNKVQYPRHLPNQLVQALARLKRHSINEALIAYFKTHFTASHTAWQAMSALQDDRIVAIVVDAIHDYEKTYFSRKVVGRCIHLLGHIGNVAAYEALRDIIELYFMDDNRFINNYELPLASDALKALRLIALPEAQTYLHDADAQYQHRIEQELTSYPARFAKERTEIGISLHEGSALKRMQHYALPTLIEWHRSHESAPLRQFAIATLILSLKDSITLNDEQIYHAVDYVLSCYEDLKAQEKIADVLSLLDHHQHPAITDFAWRVFDEGYQQVEALTCLAQQQASSVYDKVVYHFSTENLQQLASYNRPLLVAYINYFGAIQTTPSENMLMMLYQPDLLPVHHHIMKAISHHAITSDAALEFLNHIIDTHTDDYTIIQAIFALESVGVRSLFTLINLLKTDNSHCLIVIEILGRLRHPTAIPHLIQKLLTTPTDTKLEQALIKALEEIGTETSFAALNAWHNTYYAH